MLRLLLLLLLPALQAAGPENNHFIRPEELDVTCEYQNVKVFSRF